MRTLSITRSIVVHGTLAAVMALLAVAGLRAQSSCAAGQYCTVTFNDETYTVWAPYTGGTCDLSSESSLLSSVSSGQGCTLIDKSPIVYLSQLVQLGGGSCNFSNSSLCNALPIVQDPFAPTQNLEQEAKTDVASFRGISNDTLNDFWSRGEILAYMYLRILGMANSTTTLSSQDQQVVDYYTRAVNTERTRVATTAIGLYNLWDANRCGFKVPVGDPNSYIAEQTGTILNPGPCGLPPNSPACLTGGCIPPPPSSAQFTDWATGVVHQDDIDVWGQLLYSESAFDFPTNNPTQTPLQLAQDSAAFEYDTAFGGLAEGAEYLTAKHAKIANIPSSAQTQVESDFQEAWLEGLGDFAGDQFRDVVKNGLQSVFQAAAESDEGTLAQTFGVETPFTQVEEELALVAEEDTAGLVAESWDTFIGPAIAAVAVISVETWQQVNNAQVLTQLQTSLCQATGGQQYPSACTPSQDSLHDYAQDSNGRALILDAFIKSTIPDFSVSRLASSYGSAPSAGPVSLTDPSFLEGSATTASGIFSSQDWDGTFDTTSVANGWFVQSASTTDGPSQLAHIPSVSYLTPSLQCTTSGCTPINVEGWRAWLDGNQFLAQREFVDIGNGLVQDAVNGDCPPIISPSGSNIDAGPICVMPESNFSLSIQQGDEVSIEGQVRKVNSVTTDSSGNITGFETTEPFGNDSSGNLPTNQEVHVLTNPDGNCFTSSSLGSRVSGPDCTEGLTISTGRGVVKLVPPATVSFSLATLSAKTYGDPPFSVASDATSNSSGAFTFSAASGSVGCGVDSSGKVTIIGVGTCVVNVSQAAAGDYGVSPVNTASFNIAQAPLTVTASSPTLTYGTGATIQPLYSGFVNGDTSSVIDTAPTCGVDNVDDYTAGLPDPTPGIKLPAGTYTTSCISLSAVCTDSTCLSTMSANYYPKYVNGMLTIKPATITVSPNLPPPTARQDPFSISVPMELVQMFYGDPPPTITPTYSGFVNGETEAVFTTGATCSTTATSTSTVGEYPATCSGAKAPNYSFDYKTATLIVSRSWLQITANNFTKTYGQALTLPGTAFTTTVSTTSTTKGLLNSDSISSVTLTSAGTAASASVQAEPYPVVPSAPVGTGLSNYIITYADGDLTVIPATPTSVTITNLPTGAIAVGSFTPSVTVTVAYGADNGATSVAVNASDAGICTISSTGVVSFVGAGTCYLMASVVSTTNYKSFSGTQSFTILSPQMATGNIINGVNTLYTAGVLTSGQQNSMVKDLQQAIAMMNKGKISGAIQNLQYFISEVNDLYSSGVLNQTEAGTLITGANNVINALE